MIEIIPAVLGRKIKDVASHVAQVKDVVQTVQIDVCDGVFVSSVSWPYSSPVVLEGRQNYDDFFKDIIEGEGEVDMPMWEDVMFELDLMIAKPEDRIKDLLAIGPSRVVFHAESFDDIHSQIYPLAKKIPPMVAVGMAINVDTNPEILFPLIDDKIISFVQCMGISQIGSQGQPFDERVIKNIQTLRAKYPELEIAVDGAVSLDTAQSLVDAGATRLVVGSAIFTALDVPARIAQFENLLQ